MLVAQLHWGPALWANVLGALFLTTSWNCYASGGRVDSWHASRSAERGRRDLDGTADRDRTLCGSHVYRRLLLQKPEQATGGGGRRAYHAYRAGGAAEELQICKEKVEHQRR